MAIVHDTFTFFDHKHGLISERGTGRLPMVRGQFFGVRGEAYIIGRQYGTALSCELILDQYDSLAALGNAVVALKALQGVLTGTLTEQTAGGFTRSWPNTVFVGFEETRPVFLDGTGESGYVQFTRLFWQHSNNGDAP